MAATLDGSSLTFTRTCDLAYNKFAGYISGSGNYVSFFIPLNVKATNSVSFAYSNVVVYTSNGALDVTNIDTTTDPIIIICDLGVAVELKFKSTQSANRAVTVGIGTGSISIT